VGLGWAEFLKRIRRLVAEGRQDPVATWKKFEELARSSPQAQTLEIIISIGRRLPEHQRYRLAVAVTRILAPIEWPAAWDIARPELVEALDVLVEETNPEVEGSFFALLATSSDADTHSAANVILYTARNLLSKPCRRDELRTVATLCNSGIAICLMVYRSSRVRRRSRDIGRAADRFRDALTDYADSAALLNEAMGAVLFEGLHAGIEAEED